MSPSLEPNPAPRRSSLLLLGAVVTPLGLVMFAAAFALVYGGPSWRAALFHLGMPLGLLLGCVGLVALLAGIRLERRFLQRRP